MNKPEIVSLISARAEITRKAASVVLESIVNTIHTTLQDKDGSIRIPELGTFKVLEMNERRGVNPRTGETMTIPAMRVPRFSPSKALREAVRGTK